MDIVLKIVSAARALRERAGIRVRQPLPELRVAVTNELVREAVELLQDHLCDELNIKKLTRVESVEELISLEVKPDFSKLGPKYGRKVQKIVAAVQAAGQEKLKLLQQGETIAVKVNGSTCFVEPDEVHVQVVTQEGWLVDSAGEVQVALRTELTPELIREGLARDTVRHIQQLRKERRLNIEDRIRVCWSCADAELRRAIVEWADYISQETLCVEMSYSDQPASDAKKVKLAGKELHIDLEKVQQPN